MITASISLPDGEIDAAHSRQVCHLARLNALRHPAQKVWHLPNKSMVEPVFGQSRLSTSASNLTKGAF